MKNNCIYKYVCGGDSCARCHGNATLSEIKKKLKTTTDEKLKRAYTALIKRYEKGGF